MMPCGVLIRLRRLALLMVAAFPVVMLAAGTAHATSLAVTVAPVTVGSRSAPAVQSVTFALSNIASTGDGEPTEALVRVEQQLPLDFANELGRFATCPASALAKVGSTPPPCPVGSQVGTASLSAYIPSLLSSVSTDEGYIYKSGPGRFRAWVHVDRLRSNAGVATSINVSLTLPGTVTQGSSTVGPIATWDLSAAVDMGVQARISRLVTDWMTGRTQPARQTTPARHRQPQRRHKTARRRRSRRTHSRSAHRRKAQPHRVAAGGDPTGSVFESTGCTGGSWGFSATAGYSDGQTQTVDASVGCRSGSSAPQPVVPQCLPLLSSCLPLETDRSVW
jgi:hypothetical protein